MCVSFVCVGVLWLHVTITCTVSRTLLMHVCGYIYMCACVHTRARIEACAGVRLHLDNHIYCNPRPYRQILLCAFMLHTYGTCCCIHFHYFCTHVVACNCVYMYAQRSICGSPRTRNWDDTGPRRARKRRVLITTNKLWTETGSSVTLNV